MIEFFKHSFYKQHIVILALLVLFWLPGFITPGQIIPDNELTTPLYGLIISLLDFSPFLMVSLAFVLMVLSTFLFNSIITANQLVGRNSTIGALLFVMSMCSLGTMALSPFLLACPIILFVIHIMFMIYQEEKIENYLLNIGVLLSLASMIYMPSMFLLLWVVLSLLFMGFDKLRYLLLPITGFIMPYLLYAAFLYINGNIMSYFHAYSSYFSNLSFMLPQLTTLDWIVLSASVALVLFSMIKINVFSADKPVHIRKKLESSLILMILSFLFLFINNSTANNTLFFAVTPIYYSMALSNVNKKKITNIFMCILLAGLIVKQYFTLI